MATPKPRKKTPAQAQKEREKKINRIVAGALGRTTKALAGITQEKRMAKRKIERAGSRAGRERDRLLRIKGIAERIKRSRELAPKGVLGHTHLGKLEGDPVYEYLVRLENPDASRRFSAEIDSDRKLGWIDVGALRRNAIIRMADRQMSEKEYRLWEDYIKAKNKGTEERKRETADRVRLFYFHVK